MDREMKVKVMGLGNRLSARMGRREAFIQAWKIVKAGGIELSVRGTSFLNRPEALRRLAAYNPELVRVFIGAETENPVDSKAAAVYVGINNGRGIFKLGFLPREYAAAAASLKAKGLKVIGGGNGRGALVRLAV
jgi:hypothetical protein